MDRVNCDSTAVNSSHEPDDRHNFEVQSSKALIKVHAIKDGTHDYEAAWADQNFETNVELWNEITSKVDEVLEDNDKGYHEVECGTFGELIARISTYLL